MTPDSTLLDLADRCEAMAEALRGLFHAAADEHLAERDRYRDHEAMLQSAGYGEHLHGYDEPDWEAIHQANLEYQGRWLAELRERTGVEGW